MTTKWTEKDVLEHAAQLKSPFEKQNGRKPVLSNIAEKIRAIGRRRPNEQRL